MTRIEISDLAETLEPSKKKSLGIKLPILS